MKRVAFLINLSAVLLLAQPDTATLRGKVTDSTGVAAVGVVVTVTEAATGVAVTQIATDSGGHYYAGYLRPGVYKVTIDQRGYETYIAEGISLAPGQVRQLDPTIPAGPPEDATPVDFSQSVALPQTGSIFSHIPLAARWNDAPEVDKTPSPFPQLVTTPGVQGNGRGLVISGLSDRNRQSWMLDGIPDDAASGNYANPLYFETATTIAANPGVESYRPSGLNLVSRRGTNSFHGQGYYMFGSSVLDARQYFDTQKNSYRVHEEAGEAGGALIKDRTFLFGGWTHLTNPTAATMASDVPTAQMRTGDFSQFLDPAIAPGGKAVVVRDPRNGAPFPNNQIPTSRFNTVASNALNNYFPVPTAGDANDFSQNYSWVHRFAPDAYKSHWPFVRVDHKLTEGNNLSFRWMETAQWSVAAGSVSELLGSTQSRKYKSFEASDTYAITSRLVNHFRAGRATIFVRQGEEEANFQPLEADQVLSNLGIQGTNINAYSTAGFPTINVSGLTPLSTPYAGGFTKNVADNNSVLTLEDAVEWSKGRHSVKLGAQYTRFNWLQGELPQNTYGSFTFTGMYSGVGFADFLLGVPSTSSRLLNPKTDGKLRQNQGGAYLGDSFRVSSRLTVDYGVRWDYFGSPVHEDGYMYNFDMTAGKVVVAPGTLTAVNALYPKSIAVVVGQPVPRARTTNFHPRISAAYRLPGNFVLRGGYGEFTDGGGFGADGRVNDENGPFRLSETYNNSIVNGVPLYSFPKPFPAALTSALTGTQSVTALPVDTKEGVIRQFNATLERMIFGWDLRGSYIGARGSDLNYTLNINKAPASSTPFSASRLPYPQFANVYATRTDGEWRYDSLQFQARKYAGGVTFDTSFTWANNTSNYANTYDPYDVTSHWTRDGADRRLYFVTSATWAIPTGKGRRFLSGAGPTLDRVVRNWSLQAVATAASGQYYSPLFTGPDPANAVAGFVTALPDCVADPNSGARTIGQWFNPAAFSIPSSTAGRYGTCAMNSLEGYPIRVAHFSLARQLRVSEAVSAVFTFQVSNIANTPNFTFPSNNISNPGAGAFTASSVVPAYSPERQGARQVDVKLRFEW